MTMPPKQNTIKPMFISIEGNIGSGKSTILKVIRENFPELMILDEPLTEWENVGDNKNINLLELYYKDSKRYGFTFQIFAFMSRLNKWKEYSKFDGNGFRISQRSLLSDRFIFASIMHDMGILDEAEYEIYLQFYDFLIKMNQIVNLFGIIYIKSTPEICDVRIKKRSREGEGSIPVEYLQKIHQKHEEWLVEQKPAEDNHVLIIDNTITLDKQSIIDSISGWIEKRKILNR